MIEEQTSTRSWSSMLRISKSQIQTYLICPRKFYFQYVMGAMPEFTPASLPFGRALHAAVATFYPSIKETGCRPALDTVTGEFETEWEKEVSGQRLSFAGNTSINSHIDLGRALLQKFYEEVQPRKVEAVEYPFAVSLSDPNTGDPLDVSLVGVVDLIESDDEGKTWTRAWPLYWTYSRFGRTRPIVGTDPDLIEMADGTLVMSFGHKPDYQDHGNYLAFSIDHGRSWTQVTPLSYTITVAYIGVREVAPGQLYVVYSKSDNQPGDPGPVKYDTWGRHVTVRRV